jgi:hypothetical protein
MLPETQQTVPTPPTMFPITLSSFLVKPGFMAFVALLYANWDFTRWQTG